MSSGRPTGRLAVLSADDAFFAKVATYCLRREWASPRCYTDPVAFAHEMRVSTALGADELEREVWGIVVDLTHPLPVRARDTPGRLSVRLADLDQHMERIWCMSALICGVSGRYGLPFLIVSDHARLSIALRPFGLPHIGHLDALATDQAWQQALASLWDAARRQETPPEPTPSPAEHATTDRAQRPHRLQLRADVWINFDTCSLLRGTAIIPLSAQDMRLLTFLLDHVGRFYSVEEIARRLSQSSAIVMDAHCVAQAVCGLRRKLGDSGRHPQLIVNRRGVGYALVLAPDAEERAATEPAAPRTHAVLARS